MNDDITGIPMQREKAHFLSSCLSWCHELSLETSGGTLLGDPLLPASISPLLGDQSCPLASSLGFSET